MGNVISDSIGKLRSARLKSREIRFCVGAARAVLAADSGFA